MHVEQRDRSRTVRWTDPKAAIGRAIGRTGLEIVEDVLRGDIPMAPIGELMGLRVVEVEERRAVVAVEPAEYHANNTGAAHGGLAATLLDTAMWLALHSTMPANAFCSTLQMNVNFVRALAIGGGEARAEGRAIHRGRTTATAEGTLLDARGRLCATATTTCLVVGAT